MPKDLITQPTALPTRKVKYAAGWGMAAAIALPLLETVWPGATDCIGGAKLAIEPFIPYATAIFAGWLTRERNDPATSAT